jgi:diguanylate cyclase (GGDEF)-like protein/PAS domain S-box-containing protein
MDVKPVKVLFIEGEPDDAGWIKGLLGEIDTPRLKLFHTRQVDAALRYLKEEDISAVLLDLPDLNGEGLEVLERIHTVASSLPVVVITGAEDRAAALKAVRNGAQDYLVKGQVDAEMLSRTLRFNIERAQVERNQSLIAKVWDSTAEGIIITDAQGCILMVNEAFVQITGYSFEEVQMENPSMLQSGRHDADYYREMWGSLLQTGQWKGEIWNRRKDGEVYPEWLTVNAVKDEDGEVTHYVGVFTDITPIKRTEERLRYLASHDTLTDLPNRVLFYDRLAHALSRAQRTQGWVAVMLLDLDNFKVVNDTFGHMAGDLVLQAVAQRLKNCMRGSDTIARLGGDEFTIILEGITTVWDCKRVAQKILDALSRPFNVGKHEFPLNASIGISLYPHDGKDDQVLLKRADVAMYAAKGMGSSYQFYQSLGNTDKLRLKTVNGQ